MSAKQDKKTRKEIRKVVRDLKPTALQLLRDNMRPCPRFIPRRLWHAGARIFVVIDPYANE
jgi:hypothetical protein